MNILPCEIRDGAVFFDGRHVETENRATGSGRPEIGVRPQNKKNTTHTQKKKNKRVADVGRHRVVEARAGGQRINALLPEGRSVAPGPAHLAFEPAQTRIYEDGWLAGERP
jgi:glycerol transport system ATP-binding protein